MTRYRRSAQVAVVHRDGRVFVAGSGGDVVVLEGNASVIWDCVDGSSAEETVRRVAARVGLSDDEIAQDTESFLESLSRDGLLIAD